MSDSAAPAPAGADASSPPSQQQQPPQPTWEEWLGPNLIRNSSSTKADGTTTTTTTTQTVSTTEALKNKDLVLLYFSAAWCPPCQAFSPLLKKFYHGAADAGADSRVEIIYISSDNSVAQFQEYFGTMPWFSLPMMTGIAALKTNLAKAFCITGIPALIVLSNTNNPKTHPLFVTDQARGLVTAAVQQDTNKTSTADSSDDDGDTTSAVQALIKEWTNAPAVPMNEAKNKIMGGSTSVVPSGFMGLVMMIMKNPAAVIALVYGFKWLYKKFQAYLALQDNDEAAATIITTTTAMDDSEF